jgi:hypothetical protein
MSKTNIQQWVLVAAAAISGGLLGWYLGRANHGSPRVVAHDDTPAPHTLFANGPVVAVGKDGRVTLHVDHESLSWVLAEIDRQAGAHVTARDKPAVDADRGATVAARPDAAGATAHPEEVLAHVLRGSEPERYDTLLQSLNGGAVSADTLKTLYQTDASPRIRLLAFEDAQEATEGDPAARRAELEAARLLPDPVVAEAAGRLLEALDRQAHETAPQDATPAR